MANQHMVYDANGNPVGYVNGNGRESVGYFNSQDIVGYDDLVGAGLQLGSAQMRALGPGFAGRPGLPQLGGNGQLRPGMPAAAPQQPQPQGQPGQSYLPPEVMRVLGGIAGVIDRAGSRGIMRHKTLPLGLITVPASSTIVVTFTPQQVFRVERVVLVAAESAAAGKLTIMNLSVGTTPQFVETGECLIEVFGPQAVGVALRGDTANPGIQISLQFRNLDTADRVVSGIINGEALD